MDTPESFSQNAHTRWADSIWLILFGEDSPADTSSQTMYGFIGQNQHFESHPATSQKPVHNL